MQKSFIKWCNFLILANIFTLLVGVFVAYFGNSFLFDFYNSRTNEVFFESTEMSEEVTNLKNWLFGIIGGTIVGFHFLAITIIQNGLKKKQKWAWKALLYGTLLWFLIDSSITIFYNAWHNMYLINVPALVMLVVPLIAIRKQIVK